MMHKTVLAFQVCKLGKCEYDRRGADVPGENICSQKKKMKMQSRLGFILSVLEQCFNPFTLWVSEMGSAISEFGHIHCCKCEPNPYNRLAKRVDPDETTRYIDCTDIHVSLQGRKG